MTIQCAGWLSAGWAFLSLLLAMNCSTLAMAQAGGGASQQAGDGAEIRVGIIGLDTSHAGAFTKIIRAADGTDSPVARLRVVAAFPGGSPDIPSSIDRVPGFIEELRKMEVRIVDSLEELLAQVDAVLLTSVDGRTHLTQVLPVFQSQKPCFIDKPLAADLADALAIQRIADRLEARWFTSSSLRFTPSIWRYRASSDRKVLGAHAWSPCSLEPHHVDLAWYGIHGIEALFTAMGSGIETVARTGTEEVDVVVGTWTDGRIGVFRGLRSGAQGYGLTVFGNDFIDSDAKYEGYEPLVTEIAKFFAGGPPPVDPAESLEIMAFIQAAQKSSAGGGVPVSIASVLQDAEPIARARVAELLPATPGPNPSK